MIIGIATATLMALSCFAAGWFASNFKYRLERRALRRMIEETRRTGEQIVAAREEQLLRAMKARGVKVDTSQAVRGLEKLVDKVGELGASLDGTTGGKDGGS